MATADGLTDDEFIAAFESRSLEDFPHRFHLRAAWVYVGNLGVDGAIDRLRREIMALARERGQESLYHETVTRAWVYIVAHAASDAGDGAGFEGFLEAHPEVLDKQLLLKHYRRETLASPQARQGWLAPDLRGLPGSPPSATAGGTVIDGTPVTPAAFRAVMRCVPNAVAVVTGRDALDLHAITISSVTVASAQPPTICFAVHRTSRILPLIRAARFFSVSFLADGQEALAGHFASAERPAGHAQFANVPHRAGTRGAPILSDAAAWLECQLHAEHPVDQRVMVYGVVTAGGGGAAHPLVRVAGEYV